MKRIPSLKSVLLVDDEQAILSSSSLTLRSAGIQNVIVLDDSRRFFETLESHPVSVIILDLQMPHVSGLELLPRLNQEYPQIPVILMTASDEISTVVNCMKAGAFDYITKPVEASRLLASVMKALELGDISSELSSLKHCLLADTLENPTAFSTMITANKKMRALFQYVEVVAPTRQPIIITGETGVGKELMAKAIHQLSGCKGEFVAVNVAGLDDNMFSDTLFGHKKGAFTGADQAREGLVTKAGGGTLFLDEIGDLPEMSQIKLLRLMQEREFYPSGSDIAKKCDARILLATNRNLTELVSSGKFRNDLYYRLKAHQVNVPPLRDRLDDIPLLVDHFIKEAADLFVKASPTPPQQLATMLSLYTFPGNVRELEAMVFDAVVRHSSGILSMESFKEAISVEMSEQVMPNDKSTFENQLSAIFGRFPTIDQVEEYMIEEAMRLAAGNQSLAANMLGMSRQTLNKRLGAKK